MYIKGIIIMVISITFFDLLFRGIDKYGGKNLILFEKVPSRWKGKFIIKWTVILILLVVNIMITDYLELSDLLTYIFAGLIMSICDLAFRPVKEVE